MPEILLLEPMMPEIEAKLDEAFRVHRPPEGAAASPDFLAGIAPELRGIATGGGTGVPRAVMDALQRLEIIAVNGIGTDAIDLEEAGARDIRVTTTPDVLTDDVADMAITLLLAVMRGLVAADRFVRNGRWGHGGSLPFARKVGGRRLGILGLGQVGRAVARRAQAFGMEIAYTDLQAFEDVEHRFEAELVGLAGWADALVVAASGGAGSLGIVDRAVLEALGADGVLVNVARGSVVDEAALVAALSDGRLGGAGLDVFAHEPHVPEALLGLDRVVLQPHRASATTETRRAMGELVLANLLAHFAGQEPPTAVV